MMTSLFLFLVFFPRTPPIHDEDEEPIGDQYTWRTALTVAFVCLLHGLLIIIVSTGLFYARPGKLGTWANILGITATILATIQYLPQIWMTWFLGHVGSLSIPMMLIQTPGSFVWAGSLAARLGVEGWSSWGVFLVTGCLQGCLLVMGICFEVRDRREKNYDEFEGVSSFPSTLVEITNMKQTNARCVVGYIPGQVDGVETDDEGGAVVETPSSERTPLLKNNSGKSSRNPI